MDAKISRSIHDTLTLESQALLELRESYSEEEAEKAVGAIAGCKGRIVVSGCGTSGAAAKKVAHTFCCIECPSLFLSPSDAVHGGLGVLQEGDLFVLLSKGGNTAEILAMLDAARHKKAMVIGVTEDEDSQLARQSDILLKVKVSREPDDFNMLATSSTLAVISLFDAISIAVTRTRGYTKEQFAVIHPGGAVGKRLSDIT